MFDCEAVYNLIVDNNHVAIVNDIPAILLGHNYTTGILKHEYLGSNKIIEDLEAMPGWNNGLIEFNPGCFKTEGKNKRSKLIYNGE